MSGNQKMDALAFGFAALIFIGWLAALAYIMGGV